MEKHCEQIGCPPNRASCEQQRGHHEGYVKISHEVYIEFSSLCLDLSMDSNDLQGKTVPVTENQLMVNEEDSWEHEPTSVPPATYKVGKKAASKSPP